MIIRIGSLNVLPATARTLVFIGTRSSDHLNELVRLAEFKSRAAYRIERAEELQPRWFVGVDEVGIVPGANGLDQVIEAVVGKLESFSRAGAQGMLEGLAR